MANAENKVIEQTVETTAEVAAPVVEQTLKTISVDGQQALIVLGSAAAGVGSYILITRVIVPKVKGAIEKHKK